MTKPASKLVAKLMELVNKASLTRKKKGKNIEKRTSKIREGLGLAVVVLIVSQPEASCAVDTTSRFPFWIEVAFSHRSSSFLRQ